MARFTKETLEEMKKERRLQDAAPDLLAALEALSSMYGSTWDRVNGDLVMMGSGVDRFKAAHELAKAAIAKARGHE